MGVGGAVWLGLVMFSVEAQEISKGQRGQLKKTAELRGHKVVQEETQTSESLTNNLDVSETHLYSRSVPSSHLHSFSCSKSVRPIQ